MMCHLLDVLNVMSQVCSSTSVCVEHSIPMQLIHVSGLGSRLSPMVTGSIASATRSAALLI